MTDLQKAHSVFSKYIRQKYATPFGLVQCCTCPSFAPWKEMDNGHFVDRRYLATAFDERNNHPQCRYCNRVLDGNIKVYEKFINRTYGPGTADLLRNLSNTGPSPDLKQIISKYKNLLTYFKTNS